MAHPVELNVICKRKKKFENSKMTDTLEGYSFDLWKKNEIEKVILGREGINKKCVCGQVRFKIPRKHPSGDVMQDIHVKFKGKVWVEDINWWFFRI